MELATLFHQLPNINFCWILSLITQFQELKNAYEKDLKVKSTKKIEKIKSTFQNILNTRLSEIENEAVGQIREAKIREEQARKSLEEKSSQMKQEYLTIHEHEKIVNEKQSIFEKSKTSELESLAEKFETELETRNRNYENSRIVKNN